MSRPTRAQSTVPSAPHHIILRGNNRRRLFSFANDYKFFIQQLAHMQARFNIELNAGCLMANHVHLLATPRDVAQFSGFIKGVAQRYAQYRNQKWGGTGKLFESRFIALPIKSEAHLAIVMAYVELNPVRAGVVQDPRAYRWSTHRIHAEPSTGALSDMTAVTWSPNFWYARLGSESAARAREYAAFVDYCLARDRAEFEADALQRAVIVDDDPRIVRRPNGSRVAGAPRENVSSLRGQTRFVTGR
ncbi:MAG: transposase [Sandaracinaceae bacterium]|nr:transposase [Sandaracinaceae bacterium]